MADPVPSTSSAPLELPTPSSPFTASAAPSSVASSLARSFIRTHDHVLLKLPSGILKPVKISPNGTIGLGKYGTFKAKELVGRPYGQTYEIQEGGRLAVVKATLNEIGELPPCLSGRTRRGSCARCSPCMRFSRTEETAANNENIASTGNQSLSFVDIKALKESGMSGRIEEHKAYDLKTEYSKEKYLKRKEAKYLQLFTPLPPTIHQLAQYNFDKVPSKTRDLRPDTLANLLAMANVRPGSRLLVVENLGGMITGACVERMGVHPLGRDRPGVESAGSAARSRGELILACEYEPYSIIERLIPRLAGSAPIVVYSPHVQILFSALLPLRTHPAILSPTIHEPFLRRYQVLPGRAHPEMQGMGSGGFLMTMTRVLENEGANSVSWGRREKRRLLKEKEREKGATEGSEGERNAKKQKVEERVKADEVENAVERAEAAVKAASEECPEMDEA
ncbi:SPOSA6832_04030, partial [Sporobolomyces salmonicolor]